MKMPFAFLAALTLAALLGNGPASAVTSGGQAPRSTETLTFNTALTPQYYGAGEFDGVLHITIAPDGTVNGWYHNDDAGSIRTVTGGLDGDKLWLDLGAGALFNIQGTLDNGKIVAATYLGDQLYTFTGTPFKN